MMKIVYWLIVLLLNWNVFVDSAKFEAEKYKSPIEGTFWGMSLETAIENLNLSEENIRYPNLSTALIEYKKTIENGSIDITMVFSEIPDDGLISMSMQINGVEEEVIHEALVARYGIETEDNEWSGTVLKDLSKETIEKMNYVKFQIAEEKGISLGAFKEKWSDVENQPLIWICQANNAVIYEAPYWVLFQTVNNSEKYENYVNEIKAIYDEYWSG